MVYCCYCDIIFFFSLTVLFFSAYNYVCIILIPYIWILHLYLVLSKRIKLSTFHSFCRKPFTWTLVQKLVICCGTTVEELIAEWLKLFRFVGKISLYLLWSTICANVWMNMYCEEICFTSQCVLHSSLMAIHSLHYTLVWFILKIFVQ